MRNLILGLMAWWGISKAISAGLRWRIATQAGDPHEALRQADRLASGLGILAFTGLLTGFAFARGRRERLENVLRQAQLPR